MIATVLERLWVERADDIPLLLSSLRKMDLVEKLDACFPRHGNWTGELTFGEVAVVWLAFALSEGDHCLNHVEPWAAERLVLLSNLLGKHVRALDFSDDRLATFLEATADFDRWSAFQIELNRGILRVYNLQYDSQGVRVDTTTSYTYSTSDERAGLFQRGHSKDHRPDLQQIKICMATLDPLGMPLACCVVAGNSADDPQYVPMIQEVQASLPPDGNTYFMDCKGAAVGTRAFVSESRDYYACPLSGKQVDANDLQRLIEPVIAKKVQVSAVYHPTDGKEQPADLIARGYSYLERIEGEVAGTKVKRKWTERRFVVCSVAHQEHQQKRLQERISKSLKDLGRIAERKKGRKRRTRAQLKEEIDGILDHYEVRDLIAVQLEKASKRVKVRKYKERPERVKTEVTWHVKACVKEQEYEETRQRCGWRVYATNNLKMTLADMVLGYRGQFGIEKGFSRIKNKPLGLNPMYLKNEDRVVGLVNLLGVALRLLTLVEFVVRRNLKKRDETLQDLYAGQAGRKTATPSAELLLGAFKGINLFVETSNNGVATGIKPLSAIQQKILALLELPPDLYSNLA
jgi:transposase